MQTASKFSLHQCGNKLTVFLLYLLWLLAAIHAARDGDWTILLALVSWIGFTLVGFFLAPLVPYGTILGVVMTMLGFSVAWWLTRYH